ncbi:hypothetical protein [Kaistia nematophila]|uniref:Uncharacterized protein n=1 Tax=Kaistia nematophila TaxID=2994654 RepID=A0A9X3DZF3_9HYPH|nr:hypothetical protein [Kaistia nematophila]MCX5568163.1 hypothetical protein [Kaistia nematophila]
MQEVSEHRFEFTLSDLPRAEFVKLSDALNLALYGGVLSIRYEGSIPSSAIEDGMLSIAQGTWLLDTEHGRVLGPRCVNVARPGAILFDIEDNSEPDPTRSAELEQKYIARLERHRKWLAEQPVDRQADLALAPSPRRHDPDAIAPFWRAEIARRQTGFYSKLNMAARSGDVRFMGIPVDGPWTLEPSTFGSLPQDILAAYFSVDRDFDEDSCISAIGPEASEPDYDEASAEGRYVSYRDVVVERVSFLRFLKVTYPSVLNAASAQDQLKTKEAIRVLARALRQDPGMSKAAAAELVGWPVRSRRFETEIWPEARHAADLHPRGQAGRKGKSTQA